MLRSRLDRSFLRFRRHDDPRALAAVFDRAAPELWKIAACLCRDRHTIEDAVLVRAAKPAAGSPSSRSAANR